MSILTEVVTSGHIDTVFIVTAGLIAAALGALHGLESGVARTKVAAYLRGLPGGMRDAVSFGLRRATLHTSGVYLLGLLLLFASRYVLPQRIEPAFSVLSGLVIIAVAAYLLQRRWSIETGDHPHPKGTHRHWFDPRLRQKRIEAPSEIGAGEAARLSGRPTGIRQLLTQGDLDEVVPCPYALFLLLSAASLHSVGLGLFLVFAFNLGLAAAFLISAISMLRAHRGLPNANTKWNFDRPWLQNRLPTACAIVMLAAGFGIVAHPFLQIGARFHTTSLNPGHIPLIGVVALGLFLGVRHSTDADHVVAVSTIVSRERSVRHGAVIGMLWGFGHTITIFLVGSAIILFRIVIPPRVGLSMELAVAGMLILLGVLNLTGTLRWLTLRFKPASGAKDWAEPPDSLESGTGRPRLTLARRLGYYQLLRPLCVGLVHGLAGSAAVALLVLSAIHNPYWAVAYLLVFGFGTVLGMMGMTTAMAVPIALSSQKSVNYLSVVSGVFSLCFGLFLVYQIGFVDGLFTSHVHWIPQ